MQHHSKGVFAVSLAILCAAAAACTNKPNDLFDPSWPNYPANDAASNPMIDAGSVDTGRPPPDNPMADANQGGNGEPDAAARESGPAPSEDANPPEPKDSGGTATQDAGGGMQTVDARVEDAPADVEFPPVVDAGKPVDAGMGTLACLALHGIVFKGHCYFTVAAGPWDQNACDAEGAHLATLGSAEEQAAAATVSPGQERWIGLRRRNGSPRDPMSFDWVTGEPLSYDNWANYGGTREPNGTGDCVRLLTAGTWADNDCTERFPVLCEHE